MGDRPVALRSPPSAYYAFFPIADFVDRINWAWVSGLYPTSWYRSWQENLVAGGSTNPISQHLAGLAADIGGPPDARATFADSAEDAGLVVVRYWSHVHVQYWRRGVLDAMVRNA